MDLSVIIPARNEIFLARTVQDVLDNARANTEVTAVLDGYWPNPPLVDRPGLNIIHFSKPIGQRAATNAGVRLSNAKYIMKLDAHCALGEGFDVKLMQDCQYDWTMIPQQYNLHAFDWKCKSCGDITYQGAVPDKCIKCNGTEFEMVVVWKPRLNRLTVSWRFDKNLQFQYWRKHAKRREAQGDLIETMSFIGACMLLERERYWELGGLDENHGSWGQFGTEVACKTWLSGGMLITSKKTWYAHLFRTGNFSRNGRSSFPYPLKQQEIDRARAYSRDLWLNDKWPGAKHKLSWLIDRFAPIPDWHEGS
ncbi:glycosyltransferase [bacterium]|nr:MAG: glycosyltransferase [bacterium]